MTQLVRIEVDGRVKFARVNERGQYVCGCIIEGPKIGRLIAWRQNCQRIVRIPGTQCWQHQTRI